MLAASMSSSGEGNGHHEWLSKLVDNIQKLTYKIRVVTRRIGQVTNPAAEDIAQAHNLIGELLALIEDQVLPRQVELREMASASNPIPNFAKELRSLKKSGREALSAIAVYESTLEYEHNQQRGRQRSNPRFSGDQESLHKLRYKASDKVDDLLSASESFLSFISS